MRRDLWLRTVPEDVAELWPQARQIAASHTTYVPRRKDQKVRADEWHYYLVIGPKRMRPLKVERVAALIRGHWGVENRLHHILDRTFGEDARRSAKGAAPMVLGLAVRIALTVLRDYRVEGQTKAAMPEKRINVAANPVKFAKRIL